MQLSSSRTAGNGSCRIFHLGQGAPGARDVLQKWGEFVQSMCRTALLAGNLTAKRQPEKTVRRSRPALLLQADNKKPRAFASGLLLIRSTAV